MSKPLTKRIFLEVGGRWFSLSQREWTNLLSDAVCDGAEDLDYSKLRQLPRLPSGIRRQPGGGYTAQPGISWFQPATMSPEQWADAIAEGA